MLTFLSFNIGNFRKEQAQELANYLLPANADCIGLQEVNWVSDSLATTVLRKALHLPYVAIAHSKNSANHAVLLSRFPITKQRSFESFINAGLVASVEAPDYLVSIGIVHLAPHSEQTRVHELSLVFEALQDTKENIIIMGDFNAIAKNDPVKYTGELTDSVLYDVTSFLANAGLTDVGATVAKAFIPTVPVTRGSTVTYTNLRLDYFFLGVPMSKQKTTYLVLDPKEAGFPSDHYAIVTTIH